MANLPLLEPPCGVRDGPNSSDTESLIRHILGTPEPSTIAISRERADGGTHLLASAGASFLKSRRAI
jgi:hypothetical protein